MFPYRVSVQPYYAPAYDIARCADIETAIQAALSSPGDVTIANIQREDYSSDCGYSDGLTSDEAEMVGEALP
jgi:hypothetical protein